MTTRFPGATIVRPGGQWGPTIQRPGVRIPGSYVVERSPMTTTEPAVLTFGIETIPAAQAHHIIQASPLRAFRGDRLYIPSRIARHFAVVSIRNGMDFVCLVNGNPAPAEWFSWSCGHEECENHPQIMAACIKANPEFHQKRGQLKFTTVPGIIVSLVVMNLSGEEQKFHALIEGVGLTA